MTPVIEVYEADNDTLVAEIEPGQYRSAKGLNRPLRGAGEIVLPRLIDGETNPALALIIDKRLIRFTGDFGEWTMEIEDTETVVLAEGEEAEEALTVVGRDWLTARMAKAHVQPDVGYDRLPYSKIRWFNHSAVRLRDDDPDGPQGVWPLGYDQDPEYDTDNWFGRAKGYLDTSGPWVAHEDTRTGYAPAGLIFFRGIVTLGADYDRVLLQAAFDDEGQLWAGGVPAVQVEGVYKGKCGEAVIPMSSGDTVISGWCRNLNALRMGFQFAGWSTTADGQADEMLFRADASWVRVLAFPDLPPGFTPTELIRLVLDEEQNNDGLPGVGCSFISASDTAGEPVTEISDIALPAPSSSILTFLQMLQETHLDIDGTPGTPTSTDPAPTGTLEINAWIRGTRGSNLSATVVLEKGTAKRIAHDAKGSERATVALVSGDTFAPFQVFHADYSDTNRYSIPLEFGDASPETAAKWATEILNLLSEGRKGIKIELHPGGPFIPGDDFTIGDTIGILEPDDTVGPHRVDSWGFEIDATSIVKYLVELDQPAARTEERLSAFLRRYAPGGAGGRTLLPSPTDPSFPTNTEGEEFEKEWHWQGPLDDVQFYINGTPITGAVVSGLVAPGDTNKTTVTGSNDASDERRYVMEVDGFTFTAGGSSNQSPKFTPTKGRWLQEIRASCDENDDGTHITITASFR